MSKPTPRVMNPSARRTLAVAGTALAAGLFAGCRHDTPAAQSQIDLFPKDDLGHQIHKISDVQAAAGARTDAMLRVAHFDDAVLNSLGESKLDLMLVDDDLCDPLVIYLDVPQDDMTAARRDAVAVYLKDCGLTETQIKIENGPNTKASYPAAPGIRAKKALDSIPPVGVNPEPTGSAGGPAVR